MRILAIDMGTGTQDILLFDSERPVENSVKMVMPSATEMAARRIRRAAAQGVPVVLTGTVAGGGPCAWALEEFISAGGRAFATPTAAQTFDDDLARVEEMGVTLVSDDEAATIEGARVPLADLDLEAVGRALTAFEESSVVDGFALGCLDHGAAPPGVSDRRFRFEHLERTVHARNDLLAFACAPQQLPGYLTRARALVSCAQEVARVAFMDTGPAAALGALHDEAVAAEPERVVLNLGNMHLLGFHLQGRRIASLFEHHTGEVSNGQIVALAGGLASGALTNEEVFRTKGHGAVHYDRSLVSARLPGMVAVTGPQRERIRESELRPFFAAPFGDMMISGCFGLLRAFAEVHPEAAEEVERRLGPLDA
jgi:uncharacterized protein (DUF1786 family)